MPKGYVILTESIKDPEGMKAYGRAAGAAMGGVNILAVDTKATVIEGTWHGDQTVVLEFESVDAARAWYESEAYQEGREATSGRRRLQRGDHLRVCLSRNRLRLVHADLVADRRDDDQATTRGAERVRGLR